MRKLIHSKFELDLSPFKLSDTEENNWFSDSFFAKYSFPFEIDLTEEWDIVFDFISFYNTSPETYYELEYYDNTKIEDAVFVIESHQDKLSCILYFGLEQLPNFDKKLADLPLAVIDLPTGTSIYQHAESMISKTWPEVNYNFPQIYTDKYIDEDDFGYFEGAINNRKEGVFLENYVDVANETSHNINVMQPLPYWLYILQKGFEDAGYQLDGEILDDVFIKKATMYFYGDYFKRTTVESSSFIVNAQEFTEYIPSDTRVFYNKTQPLPSSKGDYRITGKVFIQSHRDWEYASIRVNGVIVWEMSDSNKFPRIEEHDVNVMFSLNESTTNSIQFYSHQKYIWPLEINVLDITVETVFLRDNNNIIIPSVVNKNRIELTKAVPDITFGDFVTVIKNWFNYDLTVDGKKAVMNKIENEINYSNADDFQFSEVKKPLRNFNQGKSFELKFSEIDNKNFVFLPVFHNKSGVFYSAYKTNSNTSPIEINALPLPKTEKNGIATAYVVDSSESKIYLVPYSGLKNGLNLSDDITDYLLPAVHLNYWKKWFNFRINAVPFTWPFKAFNERIINLKVKTKIFAYNRFHIIKTINKTEIEPDLYEVDIETEALP